MKPVFLFEIKYEPITFDHKKCVKI